MPRQRFQSWNKTPSRVYVTLAGAERGRDGVDYLRTLQGVDATKETPLTPRPDSLNRRPLRFQMPRGDLLHFRKSRDVLKFFPERFAVGESF
jgi:hypothetical protein